MITPDDTAIHFHLPTISTFSVRVASVAPLVPNSFPRIKTKLFILKTANSIDTFLSVPGWKRIPKRPPTGQKKQTNKKKGKSKRKSNPSLFFLISGCFFFFFSLSLSLSLSLFLSRSYL